jgi:adenylate cyclase
MPSQGQWLRRHATVLGLGVLISAAGLLLPQQVEHLERSLADVAQELRGRRPVPPGVVIVAIDDYSLQQANNADLSAQTELRQLQQWPWPRRSYAAVLERLFGAGARAVAFDLMFDQPSSHGPGDDASLASALRRHRPRVVLASQVLESRGAVAGLSLIPPQPQLLEAAGRQQLGLLNGFQDRDGTLRQRPDRYAQQLRQRLGRAVPPSLAMALLRSGDRPAQPERLPAPWQPLLDPYGPPRTIPTIPIWQVLDNRSYAELRASGELQNALVLIGPTAAVLQDLHHTVFAGAEGMPGVEVHATELANRLEGRALYVHAATPLWALLLGWMVVALALAAERWERPLTRLGVMAAVAAGLLLLSLLLVGQLGLGVRLLSLSLGVLSAGVVSSADATLRLQWQRRRLRRSLERYLSPAVADQIANQPEEADGLLGGQLTDVVVLMSDIRQFTAYTQEMTRQGRVPELVARLNRYFSRVVEILHLHGATVDKFIGDAALAVFGAPLQRGATTEVEAALAAAVDLQRALEQLNREWEEQGEAPWQQVVVLSYGTVISGNIGSSSRMDYTVIGDAVNTASRLEAIAKQCGEPIVLSAAVAELVSDRWSLRDIGTFAIRGQEAQRVYALQSVHEQQSPGDQGLQGA